ncbi:MAG: sugar phosphate isomerase/epimerase [Sphingomonadales bacterium]|nr:MAG: sugar phosphate isomerase/epimerase [Sphingomonadales bacterium]
MMINRRQWLAGGAALATTLAAGPLAARSLKAKPIGIQLYTLRDLFTADPMATLEKVAAIGYREIEFGGGGYDKLDHAALRKTMDRLGLTCPSLHIGYEALASDFDGSVKMAKTLGADTVVLPWMVPELRNGESWKGAIANFSLWAGKLKAAGLGFAYHNHDFEFTVKSEGRSLFDMLVADTDPALVKIELDLYWTVAAGEDAKAVIRRLPGRVYAYHVKDRTGDGKMTSVGAGTIDFADIFTLNKLAGVQHFYVENDQSPAPYLPDITASFAALSRLRA